MTLRLCFLGDFPFSRFQISRSGCSVPGGAAACRGIQNSPEWYPPRSHQCFSSRSQCRPPAHQAQTFGPPENHDRQKLRGTGVNLHVIHTASRLPSQTLITSLLCISVTRHVIRTLPLPALFLCLCRKAPGYVEAEEFLMDKISSAHRPPPHALREDPPDRPAGRERRPPSAAPAAGCRRRRQSGGYTPSRLTTR